MVFASSAAVYGDVRRVPIKEQAETRPISPYGAVARLHRRTLLNVTRRIPEGQVATGIVLGAVSLSAGILNTAVVLFDRGLA
jgi:hypothetical protein